MILYHYSVDSYRGGECLINDYKRGFRFAEPFLLALDAGDIPVYMHIPAEKMTLLCPRNAWCSGSESCLHRLKDALGPDNVVLK